MPMLDGESWCLDMMKLCLNLTLSLSLIGSSCMDGELLFNCCRNYKTGKLLSDRSWIYKVFLTGRNVLYFGNKTEIRSAINYNRVYVLLKIHRPCRWIRFGGSAQKAILNWSTLVDRGKTVGFIPFIHFVRVREGLIQKQAQHTDIPNKSLILNKFDAKIGETAKISGCLASFFCISVQIQASSGDTWQPSSTKEDCQVLGYLFLYSTPDILICDMFKLFKTHQKFIITFSSFESTLSAWLNLFICKYFHL